MKNSKYKSPYMAKTSLSVMNRGIIHHEMEKVMSKKSKVEEVRNYYLSRLDDIRDEKLGYSYSYYGDTGMGETGYNCSAMSTNSLKLSLFKQGKFGIRNVDTTKLSHVNTFEDIIDTFLKFEQRDIADEVKRLADEDNKKREDEKFRVASIISIYNELKDKFMFTKLSNEDMYDDLQYFTNIDVSEDAGLEATKVAIAC